MILNHFNYNLNNWLDVAWKNIKINSTLPILYRPSSFNPKELEVFSEKLKYI